MKKVVLLFSAMMIALLMTGCRPYDTPEFVVIEASQTGFLIPLTGDTGEQAVFESQALLEEVKIPTKEVQIPHRWVQNGLLWFDGEYRDNAIVYIVERKPVTREWTANKETGSSSKNQAIYSESSESIGFSVGMNCSAQINEEDASLFAYRYNNKPLEEIMDTEIRAMVESEFNKECAKYPIAEIIKSKQEIMKVVVENVSTFFAERGITITVLGMKEGISYEDAAIQDAINDKFSSEQLLVTQQNNNEVTLSRAQAEADAIIIEAEAEAEANTIISQSLTQMLIDMEIAESWAGNVPQVTGGATPFISLD